MALRTSARLGTVLVAALAILSWATGSVFAAGVRLRETAAIYVDAAGAPIGSPAGLACDPETLAVADPEGGRIVLFDISGDGAVARDAVAVPELPSPRDLALDGSGGLIVLDGRMRRVGTVGADGAFAGYLDVGEDDLGRDPIVRAIDRGRDGATYLLDVHGNRVVVISPGAAPRSVALAHNDGFYSDLAVGADGSVYVLDAVGAQIHVARPGSESFEPLGGTFAEDLDFATAVADDDRGNLFVVDRNGGGIVAIGTDGEFRGRQLQWGWQEGQLRYPNDVCVDGRGRMFVADGANRRVQVFEVLD